MLRWLRRLVTGLALAMGLGMLAVVAVVWARLGAPALPPPAVPAAITLPDGAVVEAVTFAHDWVVVVLKGGVVLIYDANGALRQRVVLEGGAL